MKRSKENQILKCLTLILLLLFVASCSKKCSTEPENELRWNKVQAFGDEEITSLHINSTRTQLSLTTAGNFAVIFPGKVEPDIIKNLETTIIDYSYIPSFSDEYYFYCDNDGQTMYIGDNSNGEFIGSISITSLVDSINFPANFASSDGINISNHIEHNENGLYMISLRQTGLNPLNQQDDRLLFGNLELERNNLIFNVVENIKSYNEPSLSAFIYSNYYYGGSFWQYRRGDIKPPMTVIDANSFSTQYLTFYPKIRYVFECEDYLVGVFDALLKKSFDGGYTWHDWVMLNASWDHVEIFGKHIFYYSHNYASINFDTLEITNYDNGELEENCIVGMVEFDGKAFAATLNGLFYCDSDDFFLSKTVRNQLQKDDLNYELIDKPSKSF